MSDLEDISVRTCNIRRREIRDISQASRRDGSACITRWTGTRRNLCGYTPEGKVVLRDMAEQGANSWAGTMSLVSDNSLQVQGCMPGGGLCGSETWSRTR